MLELLKDNRDWINLTIPSNKVPELEAMCSSDMVIIEEKGSNTSVLILMAAQEFEDLVVENFYGN